MTEAERMQVSCRIERWPLARPFTISRGTRVEATTLTVELQRGKLVGRGESVPYARLGETPESALAQVRQLAAEGLPATREELQRRLPAGSARNAVDCAMWDLESRTQAVPVWQLADLPPPGALVTAYTVSLDSPAAMGKQARTAADRPFLKVKLGGDAAREADRLRAVRDNAPDARLLIDANEGWSSRQLEAMFPALEDCQAELLEQPLPEAEDEALAGMPSPAPLCADESCRTVEDLDRLAGRYRFVNVKLDKAGGLTGALRLLREARRRKFGVFVGCMMGGSLSIAPAFLLAAAADYVDLDGPLYLAEDRPGGFRPDGPKLLPTATGFWGDG